MAQQNIVQPHCVAAALVILLVTSILNSCGSATTNEPSQESTTRPFATYASLAPSNTEIVYQLGAEENLVGVSSECDFPSAARSKPRIGSFTSVDLEKLTQLKPQGILLVDGQESVAAIVEKHPELHCKAVVLRNQTLDQIADNIARVGELTGHSKEGSAAYKDFHAFVESLRANVHTVAQRPKVFLCIWPDPLITVGKSSYLNDCITTCGGNNIAGNLQQSYPHFSLEELLIGQPDLIILPDEARKQDFYKKAPWNKLKAVQSGSIVFLPPRDADRLSRPSSRLKDGLTWLATVITKAGTQKSSPAPPLVKQ